MDHTITILRDSLARLLAERVTPARTASAEAVGIDEGLWAALGELGVRGDDIQLEVDAQMAVLQEIGRSAALVPYAESEVLGRWLSSAAALTPGDGALAVLTGELEVSSPVDAPAVLRLKGCMVPWGRHASLVLILCRARDGWRVAQVEPAALRLRAEANIAGEPRDVVTAASVEVPASRVHRVGSGVDGPALRRLGALCRTASMVGALGAANDLALRYAQDRTQFGKPISQFQVIQSYLAEMAAEVCAAAVALDLAVAGAMSGAGWGDVAAAKIRAGQAARVVTRLAHQVHGAIGMTHEYPLHVWTRRLWAWREEFGSEEEWGRELGESLIASGADAFWPRMAGDTLALDPAEARAP
jgi:hypothetical protein